MKTPICDFLKAYGEGDTVRAHMPGHKGRGDLLARYDLTNEVHEGVIFEGKKVEKTKSAVLHYGIPDITTAVEKQNHYSNLKAKEKFEKGKKASILKLLCIYPFTFLAQYFGKQNFRDGWAGFIRSTLLANYAFMKEAKLMSHWHRASSKAIK